MATERDVKRQSLASVDSGIASVVFLDVESQDSLAVPDDAASLTSSSNTSLLSLPVMKGSPSLQSLGGSEGTDSVQVSPQLLAVWPKKCAFIVEEILQTENAYLMSLTETVKGYMNPLYYMDGLDQVDAVEGIFGNIQDLHQLHDRFLLVLQSAATDRVKFAHSFMQYAKELQEKYSVYCTQHPKAMECLQKMMETKTAVEFFGKCQRSLGHALPLSSLLLKPVQRILRYKLLLEKLQEAAAKTLQDPQACTAIQDALNEMACIADEINQRKKEHELLQDIQANLTGWSGGDLAQYGKLLLEDTLKVAGSRSERLVLLLEGLLLVLKRKESKYLYKQHIHMNRMMVQDKGTNGKMNAIRVYEQHNVKDVTVLLFPSVPRKQEWLDALMQRILGSITAAKTTSKPRPGTPKPQRQRTKGQGIPSPLSRSKRRKFSKEGKVSVAEFLMQMTESPLAARRKGGAGKKKGGRNKTKTLPNAGSRDSTVSPEGPRPRSDSWSPDMQPLTAAPNPFTPLLDLEDSFESSFEMSRTMEQMGQYPGDPDLVPDTSVPPNGLEPHLSVGDIEPPLGDDDTYTNQLTSSPVCQRSKLAATSGQVTPTTCTTATSPVSTTATVVSDVGRVSVSPPLAHMQRNTSYLEAITFEKEKENEGGYLSTSSGDVCLDNSDTATTDTDSDGELVISYGKSPVRFPHSPLVRQKPLEKLHGTHVRRRYGSSSSSMQEGAEGGVSVAEPCADADEGVSSPVEQDTTHSQTTLVVQGVTSSGERAEVAGSLTSPNVDVPLADCMMNNNVEVLNDTVSVGVAPVALEQKCVPSLEGSTVEAETGRSSEENNELVSLEGPSPLRRQGSVKKLIANFEKAQASSEMTASSQQRKAPNTGIPKSADSLCDVSSSAQQQAPPPDPIWNENVKSESKLTEPLADYVDQSERPKIRQPLRPVQNREFVSVKVSAVQGMKQQKRKSSERSGADESEYSTDVQGSNDGGSAGGNAVLSSPKKVKLSQEEVSHSSPLKSLQLEASSNSAASEETTHQYPWPVQPTFLWTGPSTRTLQPEDSRMERPGAQECLQGLAESPLVDTQSHFLPVRQRAQDLSRMKAGVEPMAHRRESVQVIRRQRQGSVGKISHFFETLLEGRQSAAEDTDSGRTTQEQQSCFPDVVGIEMVTTANQSSGQDIPCDDTGVDSSDKGLPEPWVIGMDNGLEPNVTCNRNVLGDDCHSGVENDCISEDISSCSQVQSTLKWTSTASPSSQSPSAGHSTPTSCDSQLPPNPFHEQVECDAQFLVQNSPPPTPDHTPDGSQPETRDVNVEELPCGHPTGDVHATSTQQVEDGFHADTAIAHFHLSWTEDLHNPMMDSAELSAETPIPPPPVPECTVVDVQPQDSASCTGECVIGVADAHNNTAVADAAEQDGELLSTQANDNLDSDEPHQPSPLPSNTQESGTEPSDSKEAGMEVNDPEGDQEMIHAQTSDSHVQRDDVKFDVNQTAEVAVDGSQTDDTQIEACQTDDAPSDEVQTGEVQWDDIPAAVVQMEDVQMKGKQVDGSSTVSVIPVLVQEPRTVQLSIASAHSLGEATEEAPLVYEATSVVALPWKCRESHCMMDVEFEEAPPSEEASVGITSEQGYENMSATEDIGSVADSADKKEVDQSPPLSDGIQSNLPPPISLGGADLGRELCHSGQPQVTHASTMSCPADADIQSPNLLSETCLPPMLTNRQREDKASDGKHLVKEDTVTDTAPLHVGDCDTEGMEKQQMVPTELTVPEPALEGPQTAVELAEKTEDAVDDQLAAAEDLTHAPTTECGPDNPMHAVREVSVKDSSQHLQQSPVYDQSQVPPPAADVVSGVLPVDSSALNTTRQPTWLTNPYSSNYIGLHSGDTRRWVQSETWPGSKQNDRRQGHYLAQGQSSYSYRSSHPALAFPPTVWDQHSLSPGSSPGDKHLPIPAHYQQHYQGYMQRGVAFGPSHHSDPPQWSVPEAYGARWDRSYDAGWATPHYSSDTRLYCGQMQWSAPQPQGTSGTGVSTASVKADHRLVEGGVGQHCKGAVPLSVPGKQQWEPGVGRKGTSASAQEWQTSSSQVEPTQAPGWAASQVSLHGDSTCEAPFADRTQPCLPALDDTPSVATGSFRLTAQASTGSAGGEAGWSTSTPTAPLAEGYSDSQRMSSPTLRNDSNEEGRVRWLAAEAAEEGHLTVSGLSGTASVDPSLQECAVEAGRSRDEYLQRRSECAEVALQLETSVWDKGEENGVLLSLSPTRANQTPPPPVKMTPRRSSRNKSAASGHGQDKRQGLHDTDSASRLPLFHIHRGRRFSRAKLLLFLLFVLVVVFVGLQLFVGHVGWMPSL